MLDYIRGIITEIDDENSRIVIEACGVGYEVRMRRTAIQTLGQTGSEQTVYVWESSGGPYSGVITLYGFMKKAEREIFGKLKNVKGIGSQDAVSILDKVGNTLDQFLGIVQEQDLGSLQSVYGFKGKKAEKILSAFKYAKISADVSLPPALKESKGIIQDVVSALTNMGFREFEIREAVQAVSQDNRDKKPDFDSFFKATLSRLKKG